MEWAALAIIVAIIAVGATLAGLILSTSGRLDARLTAVEKETARLAGLLEGLGLSGRARGDRIEPAE